MSEQAKKGQARRKRIMYLIMGPFLIWAAFNYFEQSKAVQAKESELLQLEEQLDVFIHEKDMLEYKLQRLNDPEYLANLARSNLYMSKPGEIIFTIIDSSTK